MISYIEQYSMFKIDTQKTTYAIKIVHDRFAVHLYYGKKIDNSFELNECYKENPVSFAPYPQDIGVDCSLDTIGSELSFYDNGDLKETAIKVENDGCCVTTFDFVDYKIYCGRIYFDNMPYSRNGDQTLELVYYDKFSKVELHSYYVVYYESDTIVRFIKFINKNDKAVTIRKAMSAQLDIASGEYKLGYLAGEYANERNYVENTLSAGIQSIYSKRGHSSHHFNPFAVLKTSNTTENEGNVYGIELVYSGDFSIKAEKTFSGKIRLLAGLNDDTFTWLLNSNDEFITPEVIITYSFEGIGQLSRNFHTHLRNNVINPKFVYAKRPIVINTWEAAYFDINENILLDYAKHARNMGIDTLVVDDGWFGARNDDTSSLGDWWVNARKFPNGLKRFSDKIHSLGLNLGIWIEPEMISPNSELFRQHSEWVLGRKDKTLPLGRNQLVLDLCNDEVIEYIVNQLKSVFDGVRLEYIKWDFNRSLSESYSNILPKERQGEVKHRFQIGSYKLHKELTDAFPNVLIEGCCGGGGRFDAGMLFYCPQIWASDNTDPIDRLKIQYGTSLAYPLSAISAHISETKNNTIESKLDIGLRYAVASCGILGYELDARRLSDEDKAEISKLNKTYSEISELILEGDLFRNQSLVSVVAKDKTFAYVVCFNIKNDNSNEKTNTGLDNNFVYVDKISGKTMDSKFIEEHPIDFNGKNYRFFVLKSCNKSGGN